METPARILIVDDDPDYVEAMKMILTNAGYETDVALDPDSGYARMVESPPDLLILDIMMGKGAEGLVYARKMRKDERFKTLPCLMISGIRNQTGFFFPGQIKHPCFLPVDEMVEKPIDAEVLLSKTAQLLKKTA